MHPIERFLDTTGRRVLRGRISRLSAQALAMAMLFVFVYLGAVLTIKSMSFTWFGLWGIPTAIGLALLVALSYQIWMLRDRRSVARYIEERAPELGLTLRSCLDFIEGRIDSGNPTFKEAYLESMAQRLASFNYIERDTVPWRRIALSVVAVNAFFWFFANEAILKKYYNPAMGFGKTHLNLNEGSITIFEPDYTQIPGRTLPLKPGVFQAYPGSRIRFMIQLPARTRSIYLAQNNETDPVPLRIEGDGQVLHEFVLLDNRELRFFVGDSKNNGRTEPYTFQLKTDEIPEILIRSNTPEGLISTLDPILLETEVKDDFGVKEFQLVINWEGGEKRINLPIPADRKKHFTNRNQWYLSDLNIGEVEAFHIYLEAKDNNPINGPGIGRSESLYYELESPDKKYDEFIELARQLLDSMTNTLGDNLDTILAARNNMAVLREAEDYGKQIQAGLYRSLDLTNILLGKVRETPNLTRLDSTFLYQFRDGVSRQARSRTEMGYLYASIFSKPNHQNSYQALVNNHRGEETQLEQLTYELLLQLKMWAILELERENNQLQESLDQLQELMENSQNMDQEQLMEMFNKLMDQVMKNFQQMMAKAAQQMDQSLDEFMNQDAMKETSSQLDELRKQIMEALAKGDMETARKLMEQLRDMMQQATSSMQSAMGEMSPEMQEMMAQMREFMGLLKELKEQEEALARDTQDLKRAIDAEMGGNEANLDKSVRDEQVDLMRRIIERLEGLHKRLVGYKTDEISQGVIKQITEKRNALDDSNLTAEARQTIDRDIEQLERTLDFLTKDGLDLLKDTTLRSLEQAGTLRDYLGQNELMLSLESGLKLETLLLQGERLSEGSVSPQIREDGEPKQAFFESRTDLYQILDALQNVKYQMEERRLGHMKRSGDKRNQELGQRQSDIAKMIEDFKQRSQDMLGESPLFKKLDDIGQSMENADRKLVGSRLDGAIQYEQEAIQKIGELMEQMQQSQQPFPGQQRPQQIVFGQETEGWNGDPTKDIYIPESQKRASKDAMKEAIRKQLEKNFPESFSKEIRKYYEKLMDQ